MAATLLGSGAWVVSPNLPEAHALAGGAGRVPAGPLDSGGLAALARPLLDLGAAAVWLKGGHGARPRGGGFLDHRPARC